LTWLFWGSVGAIVTFGLVILIALRNGVTRNEGPELLTAERLGELVREVEAAAVASEVRGPRFVAMLVLRIDSELAAAALQIGYTPPVPRRTRWPQTLPWSSPLSAAPGSLVIHVLRFIFSSRDLNEVFLPALADMRFEYNQALLEGERWRCRWIHFRGLIGLFLAGATLTMAHLARPAQIIWKVISGG
jgi:hypothetical protein